MLIASRNFTPKTSVALGESISACRYGEGFIHQQGSTFFCNSSGNCFVLYWSRHQYLDCRLEMGSSESFYFCTYHRLWMPFSSQTIHIMTKLAPKHCDAYKIVPYCEFHAGSGLYRRPRAVWNLSLRITVHI